MAYQIERKKRLYILQLMILCLIRRQSRKLSSALETIILLYESFKELRETEMTVLKEIWLRLMAKIYHELKLEQLSE